MPSPASQTSRCRSDPASASAHVADQAGNGTKGLASHQTQGIAAWRRSRRAWRAASEATDLKPRTPRASKTRSKRAKRAKATTIPELIGLVLLAFGLFLATVLWAGWNGGYVGAWIGDTLEALVGGVAYALPIGLVVVGGPDGGSQRSRRRPSVPDGAHRGRPRPPLTLGSEAGTWALR